jgi:hypothetical protein
MLTSVPIPSTLSINFHPVECFTTDSAEQHSKFDLSQVPVQMHLDNVHTNFVYVSSVLQKYICGTSISVQHVIRGWSQSCCTSIFVCYLVSVWCTREELRWAGGGSRNAWTHFISVSKHWFFFVPVSQWSHIYFLVYLILPATQWHWCRLSL